jgi:PIN domain nuclease of toxin-antitoxin system
MAKLVQQPNITISLARNAAKLIKLHPLKITTVHSPQPRDPATRIIFSTGLSNSIKEVTPDPQLLFFIDKSWFY